MRLRDSERHRISYGAERCREMIECMRTVARKPQTNADRIRSMTDEELAKWFDAVTKDVLGGSTWDKKGWLKWLRAESEE